MSSDSLHGNAPLGVQNFKHALDARLAERAKAQRVGRCRHLSRRWPALWQYRYRGVGMPPTVGRRPRLRSTRQKYPEKPTLSLQCGSRQLCARNER